jgi:hypothetical protein
VEGDEGVAIDGTELISHRAGGTYLPFARIEEAQQEANQAVGRSGRAATAAHPYRMIKVAMHLPDQGILNQLGRSAPQGTNGTAIIPLYSATNGAVACRRRISGRNL